MCSTSWGNEPPLVSHSTRCDGALHHGGLERPQAELGVALVAVEEVLHVDHHPPAGTGAGTRRSRRSSPRPRRAWSAAPSARGSPSSWRRCTPLEVLASSRLRSVTSSSTLPFGRRVEPNATIVEVVQAAARWRPGRRTRCPSGWRPASRPRCSARRGSRAARRCAACRRRWPTRPPPAGRRARWCRRPRPVPGRAGVGRCVVSVLLSTRARLCGGDLGETCRRNETAAPKDGCRRTWMSHVR